MSLTDPTKKMSKSLGLKSYIALADSPDVIKKKIKAMPTATGNEKEVINELLKNTREINVEFKDMAKKFPPDKEIHTEKDLSKIKKKLGEKKYKTFMSLFNFYMLLYIFAEAKDRHKFLETLKSNNIQFSGFKELLADKIINNPELSNFRKQKARLVKNPKKVEQILLDGSRQAKIKAKKNLKLIKRKIGLA